MEFTELNSLRGVSVIRWMILGVIVFLAGLQNIWAAKTEDHSARISEIRELSSRLKYETGDIHLSNGLATIKLTDSFRYVNPAGAETLLTGIWGNPPTGEKSLGMIVPAGFDPFDEHAWCVILNYDDDGHIKDDDARTINYNDLLKEMQEGTRAANAERVKQGYSSIELVGWAAPPNYDAQSHKFVWAKELKFADNPGANTLNYSLRVLGRTGVLNLNIVSSMSDLSKIEKAAPEVLSMVEFDPGQRYADFKPGTDKMATYGLAALVAGGVAAKTGLLKGLFVALLAMKKLVIVGLVVVASFVRKLFGGKPKSDS